MRRGKRLFFHSKMKVSIRFAEVNLIASGPLLVPFPKEVVMSKGTPYITIFDSSKETLLGISPKLHLALVFSGTMNLCSSKSK